MQSHISRTRAVRVVSKLHDAHHSSTHWPSSLPKHIVSRSFERFVSWTAARRSIDRVSAAVLRRAQRL